MTFTTMTRAVPLAKAAAAALIGCLICGVVGLAVGVGVGIEWQRGRQAQAENSTLRTDVEQLLDAAVDLRQRGVDIAQDFRTAHRRMEALADVHEQRDEQTRSFFLAHEEALAALIAVDPGLQYECFGADSVQHWNASAGGAPAAGAPAVDSVERAEAMPRDAAAPREWQGSDDPAHVGSSGGAVPPLRRRDAGIDRRGRGVRNRGLAALLPGARRARHRASGRLHPQHEGA